MLKELLDRARGLDYLEVPDNFGILKKAVLLRTAASIPDKMVYGLKNIFNKFDTAQDGSLSLNEFI